MYIEKLNGGGIQYGITKVLMKRKLYVMSIEK